MFFVVFFDLFCFLSCWPEEQCVVLAAWDGEMLPVAAWGLDDHEWSWLTELNGFYWYLVFIAPRLYDLCLLLNRLSLDGPGFWIQVAAVLELLTLCNRLRLCLVVSHPLQCKFWWARERLGLLPWWLYGKQGLPHVAPFLCHRSSQHWQRRRVHPVWTLDVSGQEDKTGRGQKLAAQLRIASTAINRQQAVWNFSANCKTGSL